MGSDIRQRPKRLAKKLVQIREMLGFSQNEIISYLGLKDQITRDSLSKYELDKREPNTFLLLAYARAINVSVDVLIDDNLHLPKKLRGHHNLRGQGAPSLMISKVNLKLTINSNDNSSQSEKYLRKNVETLYLSKYSMKNISSDVYELEIPYINDDDLDRQIYQEILQNISNEAYKHDCTIHFSAEEYGTSRKW